MRAVRPRAVIAASLVVSTLAVCGTIPLRREGSRTGQDAYVPLRPPSPAEAAALVSHGAPIAEVTDEMVVVLTAAYLVPFTGGPGPVEGRLISHDGVQFSSASWSNSCWCSGCGRSPSATRSASQGCACSRTVWRGPAAGFDSAGASR
ncbi:MAG: hypothetical protein ACREMB_11035, partial [Candidatus Rokuibacteriota bacterium]